MNTAVEVFSAPPPPLPPSPVPCKPPGLAEAVGLLALYFALQLVFGLLSGLVLGFVLGLGIGFVHHGEPASELARMVRAALASPNVRTALTAATLMITALVTLWLVRRRWPRQWRDAMPSRGFGLVPARHAGFYGLALLAGLAIPMLGGMLTQWLAQGHPVPQDISQLGHSASLASRLTLALAAVTLGPLVEEVLFRGVLLSALLGFRRPPNTSPTSARTLTAVAISAILFGLVHLPDLGYLWYAVPNLALLGAAAAWLRLRSGSLWPAVLAHGVNNLLAVAGWFLVAHPPG